MAENCPEDHDYQFIFLEGMIWLYDNYYSNHKFSIFKQISLQGKNSPLMYDKNTYWIVSSY
jgi:hypothetical protein